MRPPISFDHNAASPVCAPAWEAWEGACQTLRRCPGHATALLTQARAAIAHTLGVAAACVHLTSGGTDADAQGIFIGLGRAAPLRRDIVYAAIDHAAVVKSAAHWARLHGGRARGVPAPPTGRMEPAAVLAATDAHTALICLSLACNETGVVQPVAEVARASTARGTAVHCDAVQAFGRMPVDLGALGAQSVALSGHKIGAVGGTGALILNDAALAQDALLPDAGAANVPGACSLAAALQHLPNHLAWQRTAYLRDLLEGRLRAALVDIDIWGATQPRLCNTSSVRFVDCEADGLLMALDLQGFAVSTGSACSSGSLEPSPILLGMGLSTRACRETLRISLPPTARQDDVEALAAALITTARNARALAASY